MARRFWQTLALLVAIAVPNVASADAQTPLPVAPSRAVRSVVAAPRKSVSTRPARTAKAAGDLDQLANRNGQRAIRRMVVAGGVRGSSSGSPYGKYYRDGWDAANMPEAMRRGGTSPASAGPLPTGAKPANTAPKVQLSTNVTADRDLEHQVRQVLMSAGPAGRRAVADLDRLGSKILFRQTGGTVHDHELGALIIETHKANGDRKPIAWLAASFAHEGSHAKDGKLGRTPSTHSPLADEYKKAFANGTVSPELHRAFMAERKAYINKQINGEARAMSTDARVLHELERQGHDLQDLNRTLLNTYSKAYDRTVRKADEAKGASAPRPEVSTPKSE